MEEVRHDYWLSMVDEHTTAASSATVVTRRHVGTCLPARFPGGCVCYGALFLEFETQLEFVNISECGLGLPW